MKKVFFEGSAVALITPYSESGKVNYQKLEELINFQINNGTDAILVCGTTGESSTMTDAVKLDVIYSAVKIADGRVPIFAGAGSNDTKHATNFSYMAQEVGANALLSVTPYYNKTTQKGLIEHYKYIASAINIPLILYNVKSRTGVNIEPETIKIISELPNVCGIKECNFSQVAKVKALCRDDFAIYSGEDALVTPLLSLGGNGVISVVANIMPRKVHDMVHSYFAGDVKTSGKIQVELIELIEALFIEVNPIPVKTALNLMGMNVGECKLPLTSMVEKNYNYLKMVMKKYNLI